MKPPEELKAYEQLVEKATQQLITHALAESQGNVALALSGLLSAYGTLAGRHGDAHGLQECAGLTMSLSIHLAQLAAERRPSDCGPSGSVH